MKGLPGANETNGVADADDAGDAELARQNGPMRKHAAAFEDQAADEQKGGPPTRIGLPGYEHAALGEEDATRPLGSRTMPLKFVVTKLDTLAGSRVAVSGLLIGAGGVDGINVTTVNRVAPKCP